MAFSTVLTGVCAEVISFPTLRRKVFAGVWLLLAETSLTFVWPRVLAGVVVPVTKCPMAFSTVLTGVVVPVTKCPMALMTVLVGVTTGAKVLPNCFSMTWAEVMVELIVRRYALPAARVFAGVVVPVTKCPTALRTVLTAV